VYVPACNIEKSFSLDKQLTLKSTNAFRLICVHIMVKTSCISDKWELERLQAGKVTFTVIQGHWYWCHLIEHLWFPIPFCTVSDILALYFPKFPDVTWSWILRNFIVRTLELVTVSVHTKFEMPSFVRSEDMTVAPKFQNGSHDPDHAHSGDS